MSVSRARAFVQFVYKYWCDFTSAKKMEAELFDTELFIDEVQKRRCIWDMESIDYKNRALKKSAWQELVDIFSGDSSTSEQKKLLGKYI